jgi:hypothetical protein
MRLRLAIATGLALLASAGTAQAQGRTMVESAETNTLRVGEWHTMNRDPADPALPQVGWRSANLVTMAIGPIQLRAGDRLDVRLMHEFDSEAPGAGFWTINGIQSEHWSRWTMASTAVFMRSAISAAGGTSVIPGQEQNWDWYIHHLGINRSAYHFVKADCLCYIYDRVYFKSGMSYTNPAYRDVQINGGQYPRLQVAVYR